MKFYNLKNFTTARVFDISYPYLNRTNCEGENVKFVIKCWSFGDLPQIKIEIISNDVWDASPFQSDGSKSTPHIYSGKIYSQNELKISENIFLENFRIKHWKFCVLWCRKKVLMAALTSDRKDFFLVWGRKIMWGCRRVKTILFRMSRGKNSYLGGWRRKTTLWNEWLICFILVGCSVNQSDKEA